MDVFPKFIIQTNDEEGDVLIIAKCTYHKELATDVAKVKGGGMWSIDNENFIITLHGESYDFGRARVSDIAKCVQSKNVYTRKFIFGKFDERYKFQYKNQVGEIIDLETYSDIL